MNVIHDLKEKILKGLLINKNDALLLSEQPLAELRSAADEIRVHFCGNKFDLCSIVNAKSGGCSEDCKYCAQSSFYKTEALPYKLLDKDVILKFARYNDEKGILRYSLVSSGKSISDKELEEMCEIIEELKSELSINICVSLGLLNEQQYQRLKIAGVTHIHNNLETSREFFKNICTTHTYDDKLNSIMSAKKCGFNVCCGGIVGLGESMEDRIDLALAIRDLDVRSVPINMLNPIPGTPYENSKILTNDDMCRIVALYRFILPDAFIRLAGGRGLLPDKGLKCFSSGANAAITGDLLTTSGITIDQDMCILKKLKYII